MPQLPPGFILLNPSVYHSLAGCLRDLPVPRFSALFFLLDKSVAIHDGHTVTGVGPEYADLYKCLDSAMGDKVEGVIVIDRFDRQAWWAPKTDATEFLASFNPPPAATYLNDVKPAPRIVH